MRFSRCLLSRLAFAVVLVLGMAASVHSAAAQSIVVEGNRGVDSDTIRTFFTGGDEDQAVKKLYATGRFSSIKLRHEGSRLIVSVVENTGAKRINHVAFEGNSKLNDSQLEGILQSKSRGAYEPALAQSDAERIREAYRRNGRAAASVTYRVVDLPDGRVDLVFTIDEGVKTGVRAIHFVGNHVYSERKLIGLMNTTQMNFLSFIKTTDVYDPDRLSDDQELIRRYYLRNGYADFRIVGLDAVYNAEEKGYVITITVDEGPQYHVGSVQVESHIAALDNRMLLSDVRTDVGDVYDATMVEKSLEAITRDAQRRGYAFAQVRPRGDRDPINHTIALGYVLDEGPRVYIERINIHGNTRTRDYVIRREFDIGEGDPYNRVLIDKAERRLNSLGFFKKVRITNEPGSAPDKVIIDVEVEDQPTGAFSISGGYSTTDGIIGEVSVSESNFLGRGQYVRLAVSEGQYSRGVDLSFTEPYFLDRRIAAGFDIFHKETDASRYSTYGTWVTGGTARFGLPITEEVTFTPRYSIYTTQVNIENDSSGPFNDCTVPIPGTTPGTPGAPPLGDGFTPPGSSNCLLNGEASLAAKQATGSRLTSLVGYTLSYNTLDNNKSPTAGFFTELRQDFAGAGGDSEFVRTSGDIRYYHEILFDDWVGMIHLQGGNVEGFGTEKKLFISDQFQLGPELVRGFAPGGISPRDISNLSDYKDNPLGGTNYFGASVEMQFPLPAVPKELGLKGAIFADAGTLFGYKGQTNFSTLVGLPAGTPCQPTGVAPAFTQGNCVQVRDSEKIRSSVGASLLWASPLGPIRFDYAFVLSRDKYDDLQAFRFSGGTAF
jgi:outer membrane protein insertion porin family